MNVTKQLYQWDTGQKLTECTGIYVDYLIGDEVYRVEITDGTCIIPDELLQTSGRYKVWECMADNTLREFAFKVLPRPIPPNYVFTPTEQLTFEGLVQKETNKFNTNAIEKLNAYNANADNRVAEFNAQTEQIQADVSELKSDLGDLSKTYTLVDNKLIMGGIERDSSAFYLLKNIEVSVGETLFVKTSMDGEAQIALFDENGSAIRTFGKSDGTRIGETSWYEYTITVPNGAEKMGASFFKLEANIDEVVIKTIKNFNFVLGALKEIDGKIEILQPILDKEIYFACGDSITHANHQGIPNISDDDVFCPLGGSDGFTDWKKKGYPYYIAKKNNLKWFNYGIGGSTLTDVSVNGITYHPFSEPNGRYTQLDNSVTPDYISIFFGWNDGYWGRYAQAEKWLKDTYGSTIYYPLSTSLIGSTHADGTPYATQAQYDACNSVTETINGKTYTGLSLFSIKHLGNINSYDVTTWYGAWNTVLEYFIKKYPLAKIMPVVPYTPEWYGAEVVTGKLREAVRLVSKKWGLAYFDFDSTEHQSLFTTGTQFTDSEYLAKYRVDNLLADGLHPNTNGYKYIANMIGSKLMSI